MFKARRHRISLSSTPHFFAPKQNLAFFRPVNSPHVQAKLKVGATNDRYEQEADRVADQVMRKNWGQSLNSE